MRCDEAKERLSAYFDGELSPSDRGEVLRHIMTCESCRTELDTFQRLSDLASTLDRPLSPDVWTGIESGLLAAPSPSNVVLPTSQNPSRRVSMVSKIAAVAASILVIATGIWMATSRGWIGPDSMSAQMEPFFAEFLKDPAKAQSSLVARYQNKETTFGDVAEKLKFQPAAARTLPMGYSVQSVRLFDMPCCKCLQTVLRSQDGETICVFEHDGHHPLLPTDKPCIMADCHGRDMKVTQLDGRLAASWMSEKRAITLFGPRTLEHLLELVAALEERPPGNA